MKTVRTSATVFGLLVCSLGSSVALAETPWTLSGHIGNAKIDRLVQETGPWWSEVDDRATALSLSLAYDFMPTLGMRVLYERAEDMEALNRCPAGATCPAIAFSEDQEFSAWQLALVPRFPVTRELSVFGTLGVLDWKLRQDGVLPGDSATSFLYGAGATWRASELLELSVEYQRANADYEAIRVGFGIRF